MNKYFCGISVGKYQPYTLAHDYAHHKMLEECQNIIIYVINPDYNDPKYNPFTQREVGKMIRNSFSEIELKKIKIIFIKNIKEIKTKFKGNQVVEYGLDDVFYLEKIININKISLKKNSELKTEKEILDSLYDKKLELLDQVNSSNIKYLRRIIVPF